MLWAMRGDEKVLADEAERGDPVRCPVCAGAVRLKHGRVVVPHFAHVPPSACRWGEGETPRHLRAKWDLFRQFRAAGYACALEQPVDCGGAVLRPDLHLEQGGLRVAVELQNTSIGVAEIERRTAAYAAAGVAVLWLPILELDRMAAVGGRVERYAPRAFVRWLHAFHYGSFLAYEPSTGDLLHCALEPVRIRRAGVAWTTPEGGRIAADARQVISRRWKALVVRRRFRVSDRLLVARRRRPAVLEPKRGVIWRYELPGCRFVTVARPRPPPRPERG